MAGDFRRRVRPQGEAAPAAGPGEIVELRRLLVGEEPRAVDAEDVSRVLPQAIQLRGQGDPTLGAALAPSIEEGLERSIRKDPQRIVDVIFPVIGPAIRKAVREALAHTLETVNRLVEQGFSIRAWRWRAEARRTGLPFAEVALRHTLRYRVEQALLVHADGGLLLAHAAAPDLPARDQTLVSGMLTAIQEFVRDSFPTTEADTLDALEVGEHVVWIERGPRAHLALVVRGSPPRALRTQMAEVVEAVHRTHDDDLERFAGDTQRFADLVPRLEACLLRESREPERKKRPIAALVLLGGLLLALVLHLIAGARAEGRFAAFVGALQAEPGLVVLSADEAGDGRHLVRGLRDPLALDPAALLAAHGLSSADVRFDLEPFESGHPSFVLRRALERLAPPAGVRLAHADGTIFATGAADHAWIEAARRLAPGLTGGLRFDDSDLEDLDRARFERARSAVEATSLAFERDSAALVPGQEAAADALLGVATDLVGAAGRLGGRVLVEVTWRTEAQARGDGAERLRHERAETVRDLLARAGVPTREGAATRDGTAAAPGDEAPAGPRRVDLVVRAWGLGWKEDDR